MLLKNNSLAHPYMVYKIKNRNLKNKANYYKNISTKSAFKEMIKMITCKFECMALKLQNLPTCTHEPLVQNQLYPINVICGPLCRLTRNNFLFS